MSWSSGEGVSARALRAPRAGRAVGDRSTGTRPDRRRQAARPGYVQVGPGRRAAHPAGPAEHGLALGFRGPGPRTAGVERSAAPAGADPLAHAYYRAGSRPSRPPGVWTCSPNRLSWLAGRCTPGWYALVVPGGRVHRGAGQPDPGYAAACVRHGRGGRRERAGGDRVTGGRFARCRRAAADHRGGGGRGLRVGGAGGVAGFRCGAGRTGAAPAADHRAGPGSEPGDPIVRVVVPRCTCGSTRGLMVCGSDRRAAGGPAAAVTSFSTDDVPLDAGCRGSSPGQVAAEVMASAGPVAHRGGLPREPGRAVRARSGRDGLWVNSGCNGSGSPRHPRSARRAGRVDHRRGAPTGWRNWRRRGSGRFPRKRR
jgi:hypothetical protein